MACCYTNFCHVEYNNHYTYTNVLLLYNSQINNICEQEEIYEIAERYLYLVVHHVAYLMK